MLARLQCRLVLSALAAACAWFAYFVARGQWGMACAGVATIAFGHALFLGGEFVLLACTRGSDPTPRPSFAQLLKAWAGEAVTAPVVFGWRQPFRAEAIADHLDGAAGQRGVLFVHGFVCNRAFWNPWLKQLRPRGVPYSSVNLEPVFGSIDEYVPLIEAAVRRLEAATGRPPMLVCHSMGGLAARAWMRDNAAAGGNDERIHHVVTIGSPHHGTWLARWAFSTNGRQMQRQGGWLVQLARTEPASRYRRFTCIYGHCDNIVFPASTAVLPGARALHLEATAHVDLAFHDDAFQEAMRCLLADMAPAAGGSRESPSARDAS